jgi:hypothetical protein
MAPRYNPDLAMLYDKEKQKGNANRATLAVARKLVAYLMAVDRGRRNQNKPNKPTYRQCRAATTCTNPSGRIHFANVRRTSLALKEMYRLAATINRVLHLAGIGDSDHRNRVERNAGSVTSGFGHQLNIRTIPFTSTSLPLQRW